METSITEAELGERLSEMIDRVQRGEQFVVMRDGEAVAVLGPTHPKLSSAVQDLAGRLKDLARPNDRLAEAAGDAASLLRALVPTWRSPIPRQATNTV